MPERNRTVSKAISIACLLILTAAAASCTSLGLSQDKKGNEVLTASISAFNHAFRWEDYTSAAVWIPAGKKEQFWKEVDNFKGKIRIIEYQVRDIDHIEKSETATAVLYFQYYRPSSPTLETVTFSQKWFFSEKDKAWQLGQSGFQAMSQKPTGL